MTIPSSLERVLTVDPNVVGGEPCFTGTRVPLETVVDNLAAGVSVERILRNYRSLRPEHAEAVLTFLENGGAGHDSRTSNDSTTAAPV